MLHQFSFPLPSLAFYKGKLCEFIEFQAHSAFSIQGFD
jgi:hypothetical protein